MSTRKFVQLITVEYLKNNTVIDKNVDDELLTPSIINAQEINIQTVLGGTLYQKIMNDLYDETIEEAYETLVTYYIKPALAQWSLYNFIPYGNYKVTNKNIAERFSDNSAATELKIISYLRDDAQNKAEFYSQRIREYICNNQTLFPEYYNQTQLLAISPEKNSYNSGFNFPKHIRNGRKCYNR